MSVKIRQAPILAILATALLFACAREVPFFHPSRPEVRKLPNGMEIFVLEDHALPTVDLLLTIRGGSVHDLVGKEGLASVAMQALRQGGTQSLSPDQIDESLEFVGSSLEMGAAPEYFTASLSLLKKDMDRGLSVLFDLLRSPRFDPSRFEIVKQRAIEGLRRDREEPLTLAYREASSFIYGKGVRWGSQPTIASLQAISRDDVMDFHKRFVRPDRMVLAISGDATALEIFNAIEGYVRLWGSSKVGEAKHEGGGLEEISPVPLQFEKGVVLVPKKGLTQTTVLVGHLGEKRISPDKFALLVMNYILGGSGALTSRLGEEIRSTSGQAYSVWSDFGFGRDLGLFRAVAQTSLQNTESVTRALVEMIRKMQEKPALTEEEVSRAKRAILRSLLFDFETPAQQLKEQMRFHLWGYPSNYLEIFQKQIARVSVKDVERVARQYLHPDGLKIILVTDPEKASLEGLRALAPNGVIEMRHPE